MKPQDLDTDALTELFNIGLHRAAASLSDLTEQRVLVDLPRLWVCAMDDLHRHLTQLVQGELATVHQIFGGAVSGDAVLLLEYEKAVLLAEMMTSGEAAMDRRLDQSAREVITEVGNIVLSACLAAFGNVLRVNVSFSVPRIHVESLEGLLRSIVVEEDRGMPYALVAATRFRLSELEVSGYLIIVIGLNSLALVNRALQEAVA